LRQGKGSHGLAKVTFIRAAPAPHSHSLTIVNFVPVR
jgi:hypothetical protein